MLPLLVLLSFIGVLSGLILEYFKETLLMYPQLLVLIPVMLGMGGNIGAILACRISTAFHLGYIEFSFYNKVLRRNVLATLILATLVFTLLGLVSWPISALLGIGVNISLLRLLGISLVSGLITSFIIVLITLSGSFFSYRYGWDPDNVLLPVVTSLGDVSGILVFYLIASFFL